MTDMKQGDLSRVIDGGYCIGCGACALVAKGQVEIIEDEYLQFQARISDKATDTALAPALAVCPFANGGLNEDELSDRLFDKTTGHTADVIGYYRALYAGHVTDDDVRKKVTSGGIITWMLGQLLERDLVDAVIHVKKSTRPGTLFEYGVSRTPEQVLDGAKSRYYPIELSKVMAYVREDEGRYVFVGLPCFNKAVRNLCMHDPVLNQRILYVVGLVCGHLKSKAYAEMLAWRAGIDPKKMADVDFRWKLPDRTADSYGIRVTDLEGRSKVLVARETMGTNWGLGYFKYEACDYCDDIFSETADIAVGDAWLKQYTIDAKGNSVVVVRNAILDEILQDGIKDGLLGIDPLTPEEMLNSQGGGFRHRRTGLGDRLRLKQKRSEWVPRKRVDPVRHEIPLLRRMIYRYRMYLREESAKRWRQGRLSSNYSAFDRRMRWPTRGYGWLLKLSAVLQKRRQKSAK